MTHGDAISYRDGGKFTRGAGMFTNAAFGSLCLTRKRNVTWRGLIPS